MKYADLILNTYIKFSLQNIDKDPKFKVDDHVKISKYKKTFANFYVPNWSEEIFGIKKVKVTVPWTFAIKNLHGGEIVEVFCKK